MLTTEVKPPIKISGNQVYQNNRRRNSDHGSDIIRDYLVKQTKCYTTIAADYYHVDYVDTERQLAHPHHKTVG